MLKRETNEESLEDLGPLMDLERSPCPWPFLRSWCGEGWVTPLVDLIEVPLLGAEDFREGADLVAAIRSRVLEILAERDEDDRLALPEAVAIPDAPGCREPSDERLVARVSESPNSTVAIPVRAERGRSTLGRVRAEKR